VITGVGFRDWRPFTIAATTAAILSVAFVALTTLRLGGDQVTIAVDDIGEAVAAMIAAFSCGLAAFQTSGRTRIAWAFFAASAASWGGGEVAWSVYEVGMGVAVPFPSVADVGFLVAIPFGVIGVFAFTAAPSRLTTRGEALLAGAIIALSLLFVAWALGLSRVYDQSAASPAAQLIGLAYPVGDMITITVLVLALRRARRTELGRMFLLLGGLAAIALADSTFAYLTANGSYAAIGSVLDRAPGNDAPIGGIKVVTESGWFAARPSGTEDVYKIYAESFLGPEHLARVIDEARRLVDETLASSPTTGADSD